MDSRSKKGSAYSALALLGVATAVAPASAAEVDQLLDRVTGFNSTRLYALDFDDPSAPVVQLFPTANSGFLTCHDTAADGLFCIDGKTVRRWRNPGDPDQSAGELLFRCDDATLGYDRRFDTCTALTVDDNGAIWLAGKKGNTHSLSKIVARQSGSCPSGFTALQQSDDYCAAEYARGRPPILDLTPVESFARSPSGCPASGVLGLEKREGLTFYPDSVPCLPVEIAGRRDWGLAAKEVLHGATKLEGGDYPHVALVATSTGRILAIDTASSTPQTRQVFATTPPAQCSSLTPQYDVHGSITTGLVYHSDRSCRTVLALTPAGSPTSFTSFSLESPVTLSTAPATTDGITTAPGQTIDLTDCAGSEGCTLVEGATLSQVSLASEQSNMTLFQIRLPDCRWRPTAPDCVGQLAEVIVGTGGPEAQYLNFTPLLPPEVRDALARQYPSGLPRMLISPRYRGQPERDFLFEGFFGITESGVVFVDTFAAEFDVGALVAEGDRSCGFSPPSLAFDVATTVSERWQTVGGPGGSVEEHVDTLGNTDCVNPTSILGSRWSAYFYNLELTPLSAAEAGGAGLVVKETLERLLVELYDQLDATRAAFACTSADGQSGQPLSAQVCSSLAATWVNGKDKLDKCVAATETPKQSSGDENCGAFDSQLTNYRDVVLAAPANPAADPANRRGELLARIGVIFHVLEDRFLPAAP